MLNKRPENLLFWRMSLVVGLFFSILSPSQAQAEARVHQIFETKNKEKVRVRLDETKHEIHIKETYSSVIVVEIIIKAPTASQAELEQLIKQGDFQLRVEYKNNEVLLSPKMDTKINPKHRTQELETQLIYNIAVPEYMESLK